MEIMAKEPPQAAQVLRIFRYRDFGGMAKLLLKYETCYYETKQNKIESSYMRNIWKRV